MHHHHLPHLVTSANPTAQPKLLIPLRTNPKFQIELWVFPHHHLHAVVPPVFHRTAT
jgi:hypothetical protein